MLPQPTPVTDVAGPGPGVIPGPPQLAPAPPQAAPAAMPAAPAPAPSGAAPIASQSLPAVDPANAVAVSQQGVVDATQAGNDKVAVAKEKLDLDAKQAEEKAKFDQANAAALGEFQKNQLQHRQAADAEITAKRDQFEHAGFHSLWSTRSTGQKAAIALGLLAGGVSWSSNHTNRAIDILNQAEQEDMARQREQHADLWRDLQVSLDNRKELDSRQLHELSDWQTQQAAKWSSIAGKLNTLIAANKGKGDLAAAEQARVEAIDKANQAHTNAVNAKATAKHMAAQTRLTEEEIKNQPGIRAKNAAEAAKANAEAAQGGLSKFEQAMLGRIPTQLQRDPDVKTLYGSPGQPGPFLALPKIAEAQEQIKSAIATQDNSKLAQVIVSSREQLSKLLAGTVLTEANKKLQDSLQGSPEEAGSKIAKLLGDPKVGEKFAKNIYGLLDDARESQLKEIDAARQRLRAKHLSPKNPLLKSPAIKAELENQIEGLFSDVRSGGGAPRYGEGGASAAPTQASAAPTQASSAQSQYPVGTQATSDGKPIMWNGIEWVPAS